ncbi:potassium channel family protein [Microbacteriaceae bacterium 4G12]
MNAYKQLIIAVICMGIVIVIGTFGFMILEQIGFFKSLWMTVITVLTVGYGDAIPVTFGGKIFALLIIPIGVGIVTYAIGAVSALIIEGDIFHAMWRRRMDNRIHKLEGHMIVCGYGRVGSQVVHELKQKEIPFVVIDQELSAVHRKELLHIEGDATEDNVLYQAGILKAAGLVAALPQDAENVFITLTARGLNPNIQIVARAERTDSEEKLRRAGANKVINPSSIAGRKMAMGILKPLSTNYVDTVFHDSEEAFAIEEIEIGKQSSFVGKTLQENDIRTQYEVTVLAILRNNTVIHNPAGQEMLYERDMIIVFGPGDKLKTLEQALQKQ